MYRTFPTEEAYPMRDTKSPLAHTIREYLDSQHHFTAKTARNYAQVLGEFDRWLGQPRLGDLTPANVNKFIAPKRQAGHDFAARNAAATLKRFAVYLHSNQILSGPQDRSWRRSRSLDRARRVANHSPTSKLAPS